MIISDRTLTSEATTTTATTRTTSMSIASTGTITDANTDTTTCTHHTINNNCHYEQTQAQPVADGVRAAMAALPPSKHTAVAFLTFTTCPCLWTLLTLLPLAVLSAVAAAIGSSTAAAPEFVPLVCFNLAAAVLPLVPPVVLELLALSALQQGPASAAAVADARDGLCVLLDAKSPPLRRVWDNVGRGVECLAGVLLITLLHCYTTYARKCRAIVKA
jgi:hypothetical protein